MTQKTYGVFGLMEWEILASVGKRTMKLLFKGGLTTRMGVTPATYTTANPIVQLAIENTAYYRSGRIKVIRTVEREDSSVAASVAATSEKSAVQTVKVACVDDARDYLVLHHNVPQSKLRTKAAIIEQAALAGVSFEGI